MTVRSTVASVLEDGTVGCPFKSKQIERSTTVVDSLGSDIANRDLSRETLAVCPRSVEYCVLLYPDFSTLITTTSFRRFDKVNYRAIASRISYRYIKGG